MGNRTALFFYLILSKIKLSKTFCRLQTKIETLALIEFETQVGIRSNAFLDNFLALINIQISFQLKFCFLIAEISFQSQLVFVSEMFVGYLL